MRSTVVDLRSQQRATLIALLAGTAVYTASNSFMSGGLGIAGRSLGLAEISVGAILSVGALMGVAAAPLWGYASERRSRRNLILTAMPMQALAPLAMSLALSGRLQLVGLTLVLWLAAARMTQAVFGAAMIPITQSFMAEFTATDRRVRGMGVLGLSAQVRSAALRCYGLQGTWELPSASSSCQSSGRAPLFSACWFCVRHDRQDRRRTPRQRFRGAGSW